LPIFALLTRYIQQSLLSEWKGEKRNKRSKNGVFQTFRVSKKTVGKLGQLMERHQTQPVNVTLSQNL